jgi:hypothetical protein
VGQDGSDGAATLGDDGAAAAAADDDDSPKLVRRRARTSVKTGCGCKFWLEHVPDGVMLTELCWFEHNHNLGTTSAEKAAAAETRDDIPAEVLEEAAIWAAHAPLSKVVSVLRVKYAVNGKEPDWTVKDFANRLQPAVNEKMLDTTNFVASLIEMRADGEACARCARFRLQRAHASQHPISSCCPPSSSSRNKPMRRPRSRRS